VTVTLKDLRKVAVISWDTDTVKGETVSLQAGSGNIADIEEKRTSANDGEANLYFPLDYVGDCDVIVEGSSSGEDRGTIHVD
jgi:hypothetical protein